MRIFFSINTTILLFILMPYMVFSQYNQTFSVANRGIIAGPCGALPNTCANFNFGGVNWTISGNLAGIDTEGFLTVGGVMSGSDVDDEVCWVSPVLILSGPTNISVDLTWTQYDFDDFIDLEWEINGSGTWIQLPNQTGQPPTPPVPQYNTSLNTIGYTVANGSNVNGSASVMATSIGASGNALKVRVCGDNNLSTEIFTLDNVSVTNASPLPVNWLSINLISENEKNLILWQTAIEVNNDYFEVQRSVDGINYTSVGQVKGAGNSSEMSNYEFSDESIGVVNSYYYRVKQTDYDGNFDYSPVVATRSQKDNVYRAIPNPFDNFLTIIADNNSINEVIYISDSSGRKVKEFLSGIGNVDTSDLLPGVYFIKFPNGLVSKLIK